MCIVHPNILITVPIIGTKYCFEVIQIYLKHLVFWDPIYSGWLIFFCFYLCLGKIYLHLALTKIRLTCYVVNKTLVDVGLSSETTTATTTTTLVGSKFQPFPHSFSQQLDDGSIQFTWKTFRGKIYNRHKPIRIHCYVQ